MKVRDRFLHPRWIDSERSMAEVKALPLRETRQLCEVTAIRRGVAYYRPVYVNGGRERLGPPFYSDVAKVEAMMAVYPIIIK